MPLDYSARLGALDRWKNDLAMRVRRKVFRQFWSIMRPTPQMRVADFGVSGHRDHPAHLLSGGQKQLLALASVLITSPQLIIMDEPTSLLDLRNAKMIGRVIRELPQTVVLATHHLYLLEDFDRVLVFDSGHLVADAAPAEALAHYRKLMDA